MIRRLIWSDVFIGAVLIATGIGIVGLMAYPMFSPRQAFEAARPPSLKAAFERRWGSLPPPSPDPPALAKTDRLTPGPEVTDGRPFGPVAALEHAAPPAEVAEVEKIADAEPVIRQHQRQHVEVDDEDRPRDVCERHGMHKRYFHTHHGRHLSWRCVGHRR